MLTKPEHLIGEQVMRLRRNASVFVSIDFFTKTFVDQTLIYFSLTTIARMFKVDACGTNKIIKRFYFLFPGVATFY